MIVGNAAWTTALNAETKRPLYVLTIPSKATQLSSFYNVIEDKYVFPSGYADFACAQNSTTLTSASGGFQVWMVNYYIQITGGTNFITGYYQITGFTNSTTITLASSPATAGAGSAGTGHIKAVKNGDNLLPVLVVPKGASQKVDELTGRSSISQMTIQTIDPSGALKSLSSQTDVIGKTAYFFMGFPGSDVNDTNLSGGFLPSPSTVSFVPLHTMVISGIGRDENGWMNFTLQDPLLFTADQIFINGGPPLWTQFTANAVVSLTSSAAADKRVVTVIGWNPAGTTLQKEFVVLNGTTEVLSANTYSSIIAIFAEVPSLLWTVTVKQGSGGTTIGTIPTGQTVIGGVVGPPATPTQVLDNGVTISKTNTRYLSGNPIDLILAVNQNELGVGQNTGPVLVPITGGSGTGQAGLGINPSWTFYNGSTGLLNPNRYIDVPTLISLRGTDFAQDRFEFSYTSTQTGKRWVEDQLLKICGLYWIVRGNGQLSPKSMKQPSTAIANAVAISDHHIDGIPKTDRWPIINMVYVTLPLSNDGGSSTITLTFANQASLTKYHAPYVHTIQTDGLRFGLGALTRLFLLVNRIFIRHGFATPIYTLRNCQLTKVVLELGDFVSLTHPLLEDLNTGTVGVTNVLCEVISREPDYANGKVTLQVADTRFMSASNGAFQVAANGAIPNWTSASSLQKATYMFVSNNSGRQSDNSVANQIE
jgi:hypothetical protein